MAGSDEFRDALERGDFRDMRRIMAIVAPAEPQPGNDEQAEIILHRIRTETEAVTLRSRAWSHRWLTERGYPSSLPDHLRPKAERIYPIVVEGVAISAGAISEAMKPAGKIIQAAMSDAVAEAYADKRTEPGFVRARMNEARDRTKRALFGGLISLKGM